MPSRFFKKKVKAAPPSHIEDEVSPSDVVREQEVQEGLQAIYQDDTGNVPDMTKLDPVRSRWWVYVLGVLTVVIVLALGAAWMGFGLFNPFRGFSGQGLVIIVEGPEKVSLGEDTTYFINYQNKSGEPLADAELRINFPTDFVIAGMEPQPTDPGMTWKIGAMPTDGRGTIKIHGTFTGALNTITAVQVVGMFRPASFNSDFQALQTKMLDYSDSVLDGSLDVPVKVLPGDYVTFQYTLTNKGTDALSGNEVRMTLPEGFQLDASSTAAADSGRIVHLSLPNLAGGASTTLAVGGTFASGISGEAHVVAETGHIAADGTYLPAQHTETSFTVLAGDLSLKLVMNGSADDATVPYNTPLRFTVGYENTSPEELKGVQLRLRFEYATTTTAIKNPPMLVDWSTLDDSASGTRSGDTLSWEAKQVAALARLPSHQDGTIDIGVNAVQVAQGREDLAVRAILEATVNAVGDTTVNRVVRAVPLTIRYLTDATFTSQARYFSEEGAPIGSGPLPPVVGQATTYRVHWNLTKHFHELQNIKVSAQLPKTATWTGKAIVDAGTIAYDPTTRIVTWSLNKLPSNVNEMNADFDVQLTPSDADANRFAQLLGEARLDATDMFVSNPITQTAAALTTDLQNDDSAAGKGVVRTAQ